MWSFNSDESSWRESVWSSESICQGNLACSETAGVNKAKGKMTCVRPHLGRPNPLTQQPAWTLSNWPPLGCKSTKDKGQLCPKAGIRKHLGLGRSLESPTVPTPSLINSHWCKRFHPTEWSFVSSALPGLKTHLVTVSLPPVSSLSPSEIQFSNLH